MIGDFLFIHYGYNHELALHLTLQKNGADIFEHFEPRGQGLTLSFDTSNRSCTGWHDLTTSQSFPCPDTSLLPPQFKQCRHCQNKTGFNPAFYNASSVSPQQQARNAEPHFLYLAHFAPGVIKVGISWAQRGIRRLLDQGARSYVIIKTYPSALIARQYEAKIAKLPNVAETLQIKKKHILLSQPYNLDQAKAELTTMQNTIAQTFSITPDSNQPEGLDTYYLGKHSLSNPIILNEAKISGTCIGMLGSTLLMQQGDKQFGLCLSNLCGYTVTISDQEEIISHQPQQVALF